MVKNVEIRTGKRGRESERERNNALFSVARARGWPRKCSNLDNSILGVRRGRSMNRNSNLKLKIKGDASQRGLANEVAPVEHYIYT